MTVSLRWTKVNLILRGRIGCFTDSLRYTKGQYGVKYIRKTRAWRRRACPDFHVGTDRQAMLFYDSLFWFSNIKSCRIVNYCRFESCIYRTISSFVIYGKCHMASVAMIYWVLVYTLIIWKTFMCRTFIAFAS